MHQGRSLNAFKIISVSSSGSSQIENDSYHTYTPVNPTRTNGLSLAKSDHPYKMDRAGKLGSLSSFIRFGIGFIFLKSIEISLIIFFLISDWTSLHIY